MRHVPPLSPMILVLAILSPLARGGAPGADSGKNSGGDGLSIQLDARNAALGEIATDYLHAMQLDDEEALRRIIEAHLAPLVLERLGAEGWTKEHLDIARQITTFDQAVITENAPLRLEILTSLTPEPESDEPLEWVSWTFRADPDDLTRFLGVGVVNALAPDDWAPDYAAQCEADDPAQALATRLLEETGLPVFAIAIAHLGDEASPAISAAIAGVRKIGAPETAGLSDPVHIGSCTKSATAFLMATLVAEGRLNWSDTIGEHLGGDFEIHEAYREVTLAAVLRHRAGLAGHSADIAEAIDQYSRLDGSPRQQRATYLADVLVAKPTVPVGQMHYSNAGYCLIAHVCERVLDQPYEDAMQTRVFAPLGITHAAYGWPATTANPDGIWGHGVDEETGELAPFTEDLILGPFLAPAGDLHLPIEEFCVLALQQALGPLGKSALAPADVFADLHHTAEGSSYGAGVGISHQDGLRYFGHAGSTGVHWARFRVWPQLGLAVVVATNGPMTPDRERQVDAACRALAHHTAAP